MSDYIFEFGAFRLFPVRRRLERGPISITLGSREFDILLTLVEREGEVLDHRELSNIVWQGTNVTEASVRVHMSGLRKALGEVRGSAEFIRTVPGRGYTFAAPVRRNETVEMPTQRFEHTFPALMTRVIGRDDIVAAVTENLRRSRLVSVTGFAGVGKTTVALACAAMEQSYYNDGICFVDLSAIRGSDDVAAEIAIALGVAVNSEDPIGGILIHLRGRKCLIILDNCEHVVDGVASAALRLLVDADDTALLITSREPLNVKGEWVCCIAPLDAPPLNLTINLETAMSFSSMELFAERAAASSSAFHVDDTNVEKIADLCRRLEGIPLAIEFAASRIEEFGLDGVATRLGDRFSLLSKGRRTANARQHTLRDTIDWSFGLLTASETAVLEALSTFAGFFSLRSATRVASDEALDADDLRILISKLVSKSLLSRGNHPEQFKLLDMTREYARDKLRASGSERKAEYNHAADCLAILQDAEAKWDDGITPEWMAAFGHCLNDVRRAIEWCFSPTNDAELGVQVTASASILFIPLGLMQEYLSLLNAAIAANSTPLLPDRAIDGRLYCSLGTVLYHAQGHRANNGVKEAFLSAALASREAHDQAGELRALSGVSAAHLLLGDYTAALALKCDFERMGAMNSFVAHRTFAHSNHYAGNLAKTDFHLEAAFNLANTSLGPHTVGSQYDQKQMTLRSTLAQHLWLKGCPDQAMAIVKDLTQEAISGSHVASFCHAFAIAGFPLTLVLSGASKAEPVLELLSSLAETHSVLQWLSWAKAYRLVATPREQRRGTENEAALNTLSRTLKQGVLLEYLAIMGDDFTEQWIIDRALEGTPYWCRPELSRARGEILLRTGKSEVDAEALFREALRNASEQGSKAWQLRASISLARLLFHRDSRIQARDVLVAELDTWTEGFHTTDIITANSLLKMIG